MHSCKKSVPILLTSSVIAQDTGVALAEPELRKSHTLDSIERWLSLDKCLQLVLCDGSDYDFSFDIKRRFPGFNIETLHFKNDEALITQFGRGYGEGEIINFALKNSKTINAAKCFSKCSAKLWVDNYLKCLEEWNGEFVCKGVFSNPLSTTRKTKLEYIDTRFYISSVNFYKKFLRNAHLSIHKENGIGLEQCFLKILEQQKIKGVLFHTYPIIQGVGGGTGKAYRTSWIRAYKEKFKIFIINRNTVLRDLFSRTGES